MRGKVFRVQPNLRYPALDRLMRPKGGLPFSLPIIAITPHPPSPTIRRPSSRSTQQAKQQHTQRASCVVSGTARPTPSAQSTACSAHQPSTWSVLQRHHSHHLPSHGITPLALIAATAVSDSLLTLSLLFPPLSSPLLCSAQPPKVQKSKAAKLLAAQSSSKSKGKKKVRAPHSPLSTARQRTLATCTAPSGCAASMASPA